MRARKIQQEVSVKNIELEELFLGGYLRRSPLENNPSTAMSNLRTKLGNRVSTEIFEYYESLTRGEEKKLDNYETRTTPIIKMWMIQSKMERNDCIVKWKIQDVMESKTRARERLVKEWMSTSNYWDPIGRRIRLKIGDMNEAFEIVDIRGFKKLGNTGYYLVQYKPKILDADDEFPLEFPEVRGRPWPLIDWLVTGELTRRIGGNDFLKRRKEWFAEKNIQGIEVGLEQRVQEY